MEGMTLIIRLLYSLTLFLAGWLFNFVFDIQFVSGVFAGWLMRRHGLDASLFIAGIHVGYQTLGTVSLALPDFLVEGEAIVTNAVTDVRISTSSWK
jgi:hypothetical protein